MFGKTKQNKTKQNKTKQNKKQKQKKNMFAVAHVHCILATKFAHTFFFFFLMICVFKNLYKLEKKKKNRRKTSYKMIFLPEYIEEISYFYLVNQILWNRYQKR